MSEETDIFKLRDRCAEAAKKKRTRKRKENEKIDTGEEFPAHPPSMEGQFKKNRAYYADVEYLIWRSING